jgi:MarR family transcriptional regulator, organic hydroperoxide resistance regulator
MDRLAVPDGPSVRVTAMPKRRVTPLKSEQMDPVLQFLRSVWRLEHALERASKRMEDTLGISGPQRFALRLIGLCPGITSGELAAVMHLHASTVTGIVQRLEGRRLVKRTAHASDGRVTHLDLTTAGARVNRPGGRGTVEAAARTALTQCSGPQRKAAAEVMAQFTAELMKI